MSLSGHRHLAGFLFVIGLLVLSPARESRADPGAISSSVASMSGLQRTDFAQPIVAKGEPSAKQCTGDCLQCPNQPTCPVGVEMVGDRSEDEPAESQTDESSEQVEGGDQTPCQAAQEHGCPHHQATQGDAAPCGSVVEHTGCPHHQATQGDAAACGSVVEHTGCPHHQATQGDVVPPCGSVVEHTGCPHHQAIQGDVPPCGGAAEDSDCPCQQSEAPSD